jgi:hypothetical protein
MPLYELYDSEKMPLLTISAASDELLEVHLVMLANAIAGSRGDAEVQKKESYWKIIYTRHKAKERFLIAKRKEQP